MDYAAFKLHLQEILQKKSEKGVIVEVKNIPKNNGIWQEGLLIREPDSPVTPTIYLERIFDAWNKAPVPLNHLADRLLEIYDRERQNLPEDVSFFTDFSKSKEHIYLRTIHYEKNQKMLRRMPHQRILNLAVVCYYQLEDEELGYATISVMEEHRKFWKVDQEQLFSIAWTNTLKDQEVCFLNMEQILSEFRDNGEETESLLIPEETVPMYILTNCEKLFGALCLFYPNVQNHISDYLDASYYVLPSSIHEVILVPDSGQISGNELQSMVAEINHSQVDPMDVLSDKIYYYDRERKCLSLFEEE